MVKPKAAASQESREKLAGRLVENDALKMFQNILKYKIHFKSQMLILQAYSQKVPKSQIGAFWGLYWLSRIIDKF